MRMKEHFWPDEPERRSQRFFQALKAGAREFKRELERRKQAEKVRDLPDPFKEKA